MAVRIVGLAGPALGLAACGFSPGAASPQLDGPKMPDASSDLTCGWTFAHTNFDGCMLAPNPTALDITTATTMLDPTTPSASRTMVTQSDGTQLVVYHLSEFGLAASSKLYVLDASDIAGFVFAVDGNATLSGDIIVEVGANDTTHCATSEGSDGVASTQNSAGGGGGGGGGAAATGGAGTDGAATGFGAHGALGGPITNASSLSPLRGGCAGGRGAKIQGGSGTGTAGGHGGGAIQIAARGTITISGEIDAAGRGGGTSTHPGEGGGGGGAGGGVLLEAPTVTISGRVCSDGGSGAQGGGAGLAGSAGQTSPCIVTTGAVTGVNGASIGGTGGNGGYAGVNAGITAGAASTGNGGLGGGGGGGGGGVGWIRIHAMPSTVGGQISPTPLVD